MRMMTVMPVMTTTHRLREVLNGGQLAAFRRIRKVGGKLVKLSRCRGIATRLGALGGGLQIRCNFLGNLLVLARI